MCLPTLHSRKHVPSQFYGEESRTWKTFTDNIYHPPIFGVHICIANTFVLLFLVLLLLVPLPWSPSPPSHTESLSLFLPGRLKLSSNSIIHKQALLFLFFLITNPRVPCLVSPLPIQTLLLPHSLHVPTSSFLPSPLSHHNCRGAALCLCLCILWVISSAAG